MLMNMTLSSTDQLPYSIPRGILEELTPVVPHFALPTTSNVIRTVADTKEKVPASILSLTK